MERNLVPILLNFVAVASWVPVILFLSSLQPRFDDIALEGTTLTVLRLIVVSSLSLIYAFLLLLANKFGLQNRHDGSATTIQRNAFGIATIVFAVVIVVAFME